MQLSRILNNCCTVTSLSPAVLDTLSRSKCGTTMKALHVFKEFRCSAYCYYMDTLLFNELNDLTNESSRYITLRAFGISYKKGI